MAARKRRVLVTGVARWWGARTVQRLVEERDVGEVIGIDLAEPQHDLGSAGFLKLDIRHSLVGKLVRAVGIDTVIHSATTIDSFDMDPRRAHETNVIGTMNLLAGCAGHDSPVRRIVLKSSGHVYGTGFNLPAYLREERRMAAGSPHEFVRDIVEVEAALHDFAVRNPGVACVALRFANSLEVEHPAPLARYLDLEVVPTVLGYDPVLQLIHSEDCVEAFRLAALTEVRGAFNIAAGRPRSMTSLLDAAGKLHAPLLPPLGAGLVAAALRRLDIAFVPQQLLDVLRWGRTLSTAKAARDLGFRARRDTVEAFVDYVKERRVLRFLPDRAAYLYERELEDFIHARRLALEPNGAGTPVGTADAGRPSPTRRRAES